MRRKPKGFLTRKTITRYRSAITGHYVTAEYARENPETTVAERDRVKHPRVRTRPSKK